MIEPSTLVNVSTASSSEWDRAAATAKLLGVDPPPRLKNGSIDSRVWIRVVSPRTTLQPCCGALVERGESFHEIWATHLDGFLRMVETATAAELAHVQQQYELDVHDAQAVKAGVAGAEYRRQYEPSFPAAFRALFRRDQKPFDRVEVLTAEEVAALSVVETAPTREPMPPSPKRR